MEQERVSFKIANAIAKAGYFGKYNRKCLVEQIVDSETLILNEDSSLIRRRVPTYLDVWLWLWRKDIYIDIEASPENIIIAQGWDKDFGEILHICSLFKDPEEAIESAIKYLVDNDLIK